METDGTFATAVFVASVLATFHLISNKESQDAVIDDDSPPTSASDVGEEDDIPPPSPPRLPRRALPVVQDNTTGDVDDDDDDDDDYDDDDYNNDYDSGDDGEDEEDTSEGSHDYEDSDDSDAATMAATARSVFSDTLADKFQSQVADIAMTITVMKQIMEYAASQGARRVSFQQHYVCNPPRNFYNFPHGQTQVDHRQLSGCLRVTLDEDIIMKTDCSGWDNCGIEWHPKLALMLDNDVTIAGREFEWYSSLSCSSFLLGEFDSSAKDLILGQSSSDFPKTKDDCTWCSCLGLTKARMAVLEDAIKKVVDPIQKAQREEKKWKIICNLVLTSRLQLNPTPARHGVRRLRSDAVFRGELQTVAARSEVNNDLNLMDFWSKVLAIAEKTAVEMGDSKEWYAGADVTISSEHISSALDDAYTSYVNRQLAIARPLQIEAALISTQLLPFQQSISNEDVNTMLRRFDDVYCWKKILYSLRKDGFNADVSATKVSYTHARTSLLLLPLDGTGAKFTIDLWNPLSRTDRLAIDWNTYEDELKKHYGFCLPSTVSSRDDVDEEDPL